MLAWLLSLVVILSLYSICRCEELQLRCMKKPLTQALVASQAETPCNLACDKWWHKRHSPLAKAYLALIRKHQQKHNPRKLIFSSKLHAVPYWGTQNKHINFAYSLAVATNRQLLFDPEDEFEFVPRGAGQPRTITFYMNNQEACMLRTEAGSAVRNGSVPWLDVRASQPDGSIPRNEDIFAGPQAVTWYLSNHGLREFLKNTQLMTKLYNNPRHYWRWYPEMTEAEVPGWDSMDATLKLSAWRTALAAYAFCPRTWAQEEATCRLRALGLQPNKYIAIHIRRGDKVNATAGRKFAPEGRLIPARDFFEKARWVRRMSLQPDCCNVAYVAFDVHEDLPEIRAAASQFGFQLVIDPDEERRGHPLFMRDWSKNTARVHPDATLLETQMTDIKNTIAFVEAYTFIGADQSTYARFARTLRGLDSNDLVAGLTLAQNNLYAEWMPLR